MHLLFPKIIKYLFLISFFTSQIFSQNFDREISPFIIEDSLGEYQDVFSGGMNNMEVQFVDIDSDKDYDLPYLNSDGTYGFFENIGSPLLPEFEFVFDESAVEISGFQFHNWFYFIDIDADDDLDFFTGQGPAQVKFLKNVGTPAEPNFSLETDTLKDNTGQPIFVEPGSNPSFADVDNDNDYDLITGNTSGTLTFYENIGDSTVFQFKFISSRWLGIYIISVPLAKTEAHGASALEFADLDNDNDPDILWGDFFSPSLYYLENIGTPEDPYYGEYPFYKYEFYPNNEDSLLTGGFNMPRFIDIDADGYPDLFVTVLYDPSVPEGIIYFNNEGNASEPDFKLVTKNFLRLVDAGIKSIPVLADIDDDDDLDLFIGSGQNPEGTIFYFENIGNKTLPQFYLRDSSFFNIENELSVSPFFGDIDGDNDLDLFLGQFNGRVSFYENTGSSVNPDFLFVSELTDNSDNLIDEGLFSRPFLSDIDTDSDLDLILGSFAGKVTLYKNTGSASEFSFQKDETYFDGIDVGEQSAPVIENIFGDQRSELFVGNLDGDIFLYENNGDVSAPDWILNTNQFSGANFGREAYPFFADIDADGDLDLFVGNIKGGIYFFRNDGIVSVPGTGEIIEDFFIASAYPNPFNSELNLEIKVMQKGEFKIEVFNILGEKIRMLFKGFLNSGTYDLKWNGTNNFSQIVSSGVFLIKISSKNETIFLKTILLK